MKSDLIVGVKYKVEAPGTNSREVWEVVELRENAKGDTEVVAKGSKTPYTRIFKPSQFLQIERNMSKQIISKGVELVGKVGRAELWIEEIDYMPHHEKRGRKPKGE